MYLTIFLNLKKWYQQTDYNIQQKNVHKLLLINLNSKFNSQKFYTYQSIREFKESKILHLVFYFLYWKHFKGFYLNTRKIIIHITSIFKEPILILK